VVDYTVQHFDEAVTDVDVVFDTVGGETLERSWAVLSPGGVLVSIIAPPPDSAAKQRATAAGVRSLFFVIEPSGEQLRQIGGLIDMGVVKPIVDQVFPLAEAREAYETGIRGHLRGKIVLRI
jgi:NADPH:quinone reductase-like Zn-dependent oxidoreductase